MQFTTKFVLSAFAAALFAPAIIADFTDTCWNEGFDGTNLIATCNDAAQDAVGTSLDLEECVGNAGGSLECAPGGGYAVTCNDCSLSDPATFCCTCGDGAGGYKTSCTYLGSCIDNQNGQLAC